MRHSPGTEERSGFLISLTEPRIITAEVRWLQAQGHTELAVWRHFLEHFVVDLDALALIIAKLFGSAAPDEDPSPASREATPEQRQAA
jgi:hypothetical protein